MTSSVTADRFYIDYGDPDLCQAVSGYDLAARLTAALEARLSGYRDDLPSVHRRIPADPQPVLEALTLDCAEAGEYDEDDVARSTWTVTGPDGSVWATMTARADGRT